MHTNGIASTIIFNFRSKKQDKNYYKHQFTIHIPDKNKHDYGDIFYEASKWYGTNFRWVFRIQLIVGGDI